MWDNQVVSRMTVIGVTRSIGALILGKTPEHRSVLAIVWRFKFRCIKIEARPVDY